MEWDVHSLPDNTTVQALADETRYSPYFLSICYQKGLRTIEEIESFIQPDETWLHDPFLLHDMQRTIDRLEEAIAEGQLITIYGDYDADGVTSTAIMYETLLSVGANVHYYIPNRFTDGYGPNKEVFNQLIKEGTELILTVDNGVSGQEAIMSAQAQGVDVIVSDHHDLPDDLPDAYAIVHPRHPAAHYPFGDLSGAGVALKIAHALLGDFPVEVFDLAAIGTVADMVSLLGENRAIVKFGLQQLNQTSRAGIRQLCEQLELKLQDIDETAIGFKIAPILNAVGRLQDATPAVELLVSIDDDQINQLVPQLLEWNEERKAIVDQIVAEALEQVGESPPDIIMLWDEKWHEGVLGIVASRLVREFGKPAIVMKKKPEQGVVKGSARSIEAFHLFNICNQKRDLFTSFGGHHMAAGMTIPLENVETLREYLTQEATRIKKETAFKPTITIDNQLDLATVSVEAIEEVNLLRPFGMNNKKPIHLIEAVHPSEVRRIGGDKSHLKLTISDKDNRSLDAIGFGLGTAAEYLTPKSQMSLVGELDINEWNGHRKAQFMISDIEVLTPLIMDKRVTDLSKSLFKHPNTTYVFFHPKIYQASISHIHPQSEAVLVTKHMPDESRSTTKVALVDCPPSIEQFRQIWPIIKDNELILYLYSHEDVYMTGLPNREQETTLYKYLFKHKQLPVKNLPKKIAHYLGIKENMIKYLLEMFLEAKFVTIKEDMLILEEQPTEVNLHETMTYQRLNSLMKAEELFVYSSINELITQFMLWNKEIQ